MTIRIRFTCHGCGLTDEPLELEQRAGDESLMSFMDRIGVAIGRHHTQRSPGCTHHACDLKIPMPAGSKRVGGGSVS